MPCLIGPSLIIVITQLDKEPSYSSFIEKATMPLKQGWKGARQEEGRAPKQTFSLLQTFSVESCCQT